MAIESCFCCCFLFWLLCKGFVWFHVFSLIFLLFLSCFLCFSLARCIDDALLFLVAFSYKLWINKKRGQYFHSALLMLRHFKNISQASRANSLSICESLESWAKVVWIKLNVTFIRKITLQYFNRFFFRLKSSKLLTLVEKRRRVSVKKCSKGNEGKVFFTRRGDRITCNEPVSPSSFKSMMKIS